MKPRIHSFFRSALFITLSLAGIAHAVPTVAGGNGNFEATTIGNLTSRGSGLYDGGFSSVDGWTFSGGTSNTFRWLFDSTCPFGPVQGNYALNLTQASASYANVATTAATGLTTGQGYTLSFETAVRGGGSGTITVKVDGTSVGTFDQTVGATYVTRSFDFTATDTSAVISFEYGSTVNNSGYMLDNVAVAEASWTAADGIWNGGVSNGDWSTASNWDANTIAQGIDKSATFNSLSPVTATVDVTRPIGALIFSGANHTIAAGTGSLSLNGDTLFAPPTVTVASGITATIAATLNGSEGLLKGSDGTLVLSGTNNYTGGTSVANGTLTLELAGRTGNNTIGSFDVASGATLNLNNTNATLGGANEFYPANFILTGDGTLTKTHIGSIAFWTGSNLTGFTGTVDVQEGALRVNNINSGGNMDSATLNIASGAIFDIRYNASLSVDKLTGSGTLDQTFDSGSGLSVTVGSNDGSSTFDGVIQNSSGQPLALTKAGTGTFTLAGLNTYTGNTTINDGTLELADDAQLKFVVTDGGSNKVTGAGTATLNGDFLIDTTAVTGTTGSPWLLVDRDNLTGESFSDTTFTVIGFDDTNNDGIWTMSDAKGDWSFSETTGQLTLDAGNDYNTWKSDNGVIGTETDDDDSDGLTNFEEYAFGLDPTGGSSVNPITAQLNKATGQFSYTRRLQSKTGFSYTVRSSTTLAANEWTALVKDTDYTESVSPPSGDNETVTITLTPAPTAAKLFIQVKAGTP